MVDSIPLEVHHGQLSMSVLARLPGTRSQDVRIALTRDELTIDAETAGGVLHAAVPLPSPVDEGRATMHFRNGILRMHLPKLPA